MRTHSCSFLGFESELDSVSRDDSWGWHRSAGQERVKQFFKKSGKTDYYHKCMFYKNVKRYNLAQPLDDVSAVPFCCLVVLAPWFITSPSMPLWMSGGDAETRLNSSQLSVIFCSTFSSSAARPARSISFTPTSHHHDHSVRSKMPQTALTEHFYITQKRLRLIWTRAKNNYSLNNLLA